ncbi:hypothetical protein MHBO_001044 [Bonamia ostreae]|uniref:Prenyltransferase alpha-alpha toroid domain-containing protein n=1 Tax=Bonamia ostreae TaxID=126728 RepID=A0ABV2AHM7_9EUKA
MSEKSGSISEEHITIVQQKKIENEVINAISKRNHFFLTKTPHINKILDILQNGISGNMAIIESSKPWFVYWCLHSLDILQSLNFLHNSVKTRSFPPFL